MNCLRHAIIFRQQYRPPELSCSVFFWWRLTRALRCRSGGHHESGAFLLGKKTGRRARITEAVFYDDLYPRVFDSGIVRFDGRYFGRLWDICQVQGLTVVADVHTHPGAACQSHSDRSGPLYSVIDVDLRSLRHWTAVANPHDFGPMNPGFTTSC